jgi:Tol biopolymer transport system component
MLRIVPHTFIVLVLFLSLACKASSHGEIHGINVSPDGKLLAVTLVNYKSFFIYRIPVDTGQANRITQNENGEEGGVTFSPDGKLMAYSYMPTAGHQRIVITNMDGSNPRSIAESGTANLNATFAPTGRAIYFARSYPPPHYHEWEIFSMRLDGSDVRQLTRENFYHIGEPSTAPDGKSMILLTEKLDGPQQMAIYLLAHPETPTLSLQPHVPGEPRGGPILQILSTFLTGRTFSSWLRATASTLSITTSIDWK